MSAYYLIALPLALYGGYVLLLITLRASIMLWRIMMIVAVDVAERASRGLIEGVVAGVELVAFYGHRILSRVFAPLTAAVRAARSQKAASDDQTHWDDLVSEPDNKAVLARRILGLPDEFTATDLKARHRALARRAHPDQGGTTWLIQQVNWANDVLKQEVQ